MDGYSYPYTPSFSPMAGGEEYPDHGDGFGEYYGLGPINEAMEPSHSKMQQNPSYVVNKHRSPKRSKSRSPSRSRSRNRSRSLTKSRSRSESTVRNKPLKAREPSFLDAFRVLYLTPSKHKKSTTKYLTTKKRQDKIQEILKSDGLGSKRWLFYPRKQPTSEIVNVGGWRDSCDKRVKVDGDFFRKYKRSKKVEEDAPIAKLKRWELILYKKFGFVQAI